MAIVSVAECFSYPQAPNVISERLRVKVKPEGTSLTVRDLKRAIVGKGHAKLSDVTRMTLILPTGCGKLLRDEMKSCELEDQASVLALMSPSIRETRYLHAAGGLNIPHLLFVHHTNEFKSYMRWPQSIVSDHAGKWFTWTTPWSASLADLSRQFTAIGFDSNLVARELNRLEHRKFLGQLTSPSQGDAGIYAPNLLVRVWDAVGYTSLTNKERRQARAGGDDDVSECESFGAPSVVSICTASTVVPSRTSTSAPPPPSIASLPIADPSENESAYDEGFHRAFSLAATQTAGRVPEVHHQSLTLAATASNLPYCSSSDSSDSVEQVLARDAASKSYSTSSNQSLGGPTTHFHQNGQRGGLSPEDAHRLEGRKKEMEMERIRMKEEVDRWNESNLFLSKQLENETAKVDELFKVFDEIRSNYDEVAERNIELIKLTSETLTSVVTCSKCGEKYGSFPDNQIKRAIQLLCGHNFCLTCLSVDWRQRSNRGVNPPYRCFHECADFDPECTAEVPPMDDVKDILSLVDASGVVGETRE